MVVILHSIVEVLREAVQSLPYGDVLIDLSFIGTLQLVYTGILHLFLLMTTIGMIRKRSAEGVHWTVFSSQLVLSTTLMAVGYHYEDPELENLMQILTCLNVVHNLVYGILGRNIIFLLGTVSTGVFIYFVATSHISAEQTALLSSVAIVLTEIPGVVGQREILENPKENRPGKFFLFFGISIPTVFILGALASKNIYGFLGNFICFGLQMMYLFIWLWAGEIIPDNFGISILKSLYGVSEKIKKDQVDRLYLDPRSVMLL